jgi:NADH-quinone oxidoreductase subunit N
MNYQLLLPQVFLFLWAILLFILDFATREKKHNLAYPALLGIVITIVLALTSQKGELFGGMFKADSFSAFFNLLFLLTGFLTIAASVEFTKRLAHHKGEYFGLIFLSMVGMMFLASAGDLLTLYVSLELTTIPLYVLAAYRKDELKSSEAGLKYLILGAISSAMLLFGMSIVYGLSGTTFLGDIKANLIVRFLSGEAIGPALLLGLIFMIAGFGFKLALVPFHVWVPDVYEGAPTPITAFLSVASKAAGIAAFLRVFYHSFLVFPVVGVDWILLMAVLASLAMIIGNIIALLQTNIKRMLAYSSIAQIGYVLVAIGLAFAFLSTGGEYGFRGGFFHILNHAVMKGGAFLCAGAILYSIGTRDLDEMRGIGRRMPLVGIAFAFFAFALAGVPPLSGFASKFFICRAGIDVGGWGIAAAVLLIVNSMLSLGYYLPAVNKILFAADISEKARSAKRIPLSISVPIVMMVILTVAFGVYPDLGVKVVNPVTEFMMASLGGG